MSVDFIKQYANMAEYEQYKNSSAFTEPNVGMIGEHGVVKFYPTSDMNKTYAEELTESSNNNN